MGLSQAQTVVAAGFIPDTEQITTISRDETLRATKPKSANGFYEAVLLAVSFTFLLLGLLPAQTEQLSRARLPADVQGRIDE
jgi:hypothetical protein